MSSAAGGPGKGAPARKRVGRDNSARMLSSIAAANAAAMSAESLNPSRNVGAAAPQARDGPKTRKNHTQSAEPTEEDEEHIGVEVGMQWPRPRPDAGHSVSAPPSSYVKFNIIGAARGLEPRPADSPD